MELKLELLRPSDHRGRGWGRGGIWMGEARSLLGEGWSNGEDSVPALGARFDGKRYRSCLGEPSSLKGKQGLPPEYPSVGGKQEASCPDWSR